MLLQYNLALLMESVCDNKFYQAANLQLSLQIYGIFQEFVRQTS